MSRFVVSIYFRSLRNLDVDLQVIYTCARPTETPDLMISSMPRVVDNEKGIWIGVKLDPLCIESFESLK